MNKVVETLVGTLIVSAVFVAVVTWCVLLSFATFKAIEYLVL